MKKLSFKGEVTGLMWTIIRVVSIILGGLLVATILTGVLESGILRIFVSLVALILMALAMPWVVNSILKYLIENTHSDSGKLRYHGSPTGILALVIIAAFVWILLAMIFVGIGFWLYQSNLMGPVLLGVLSTLYFLMIAFFASWFVLHLYRWAIGQIEIEDK